MGLRFIFMLTRNDRTVADARQHLETALHEGVRHIGFKDVGLPVEELKALNLAIREGGATSYLEVVSLDAASEVASAKAAVEIGVDVLLGGTRVDDVLPVLAGSGIYYCPFAGRIEDHPSILKGTLGEIVASAEALAARPGVAGLDLLAYRWAGDVPALMRAVCAAVDKPVYMAGSIDTPEQIRDVKEAGAAGFTIGTAALDETYPASEPGLDGQLAAIIRDLAQLNNHLSPYHKENLSSAFSSLDGKQPKVAGQVNGMQVTLARFEGEMFWHFNATEDKLFFVHRGRMKMRFRDRDELIGEGEFIVVPHGVEHCPVALEDGCDVLLVEPAQPMHTGRALTERTPQHLS